MNYRIEKDTMGEVKVPVDKLWGAQTERSRNNFKIGPPASMPLEVIYGFAYLKKAAAYTNCELGVLPIEKRDLISKVCDEILEGKHNDQFPLVIWQTGSGTQSNMNVNEVIANRALQILDKRPGDYSVVSPLNDVNRFQSTNDTYPTALKLAAIRLLRELEQELVALQESFQAKEKEFADVVKQNVKKAGLKNIKVKHKDILKGISENNLDLITLDMRNCEQVVPEAYKKLKKGGWLVVYSPHMEQVVQVMKEMKEAGFNKINCVENIIREWQSNYGYTRLQF